MAYIFTNFLFDEGKDFITKCFTDKVISLLI